MHQRPAQPGADQHLAATRVTVTPRVLALVVDIEGVMGVLDQRHRQSARCQQADDLLDQRRLATAGPTGESDDFHSAL
ncbi:hypothetical protein SDC9_175065 [bioreactor metagenome]|uniref:Uncharacterized protein n=1 Tax=bioreactor metagenome TaxID=1076179 RepID=A0A645GL01_9ZZZZ